MRRRESSLRDRAMTLIVYAESRQMGRRTRSRFSDVSSRSMTYKAKTAQSSAYETKTQSNSRTALGLGG
jgi:hypothetical protein